jgi:hypothetical protein
MFSRASKYGVVLIFCVFCFPSLFAQDVIIPTVDAQLGPCTVDFTVTSRIHKPIYAAMIRAKFKYGFWGFRRMDLVVYTNSNGHARFSGLPSKLRNPPLSFTIDYRNAESTWFWTGLQCHEQPLIVLEIE